MGSTSLKNRLHAVYNAVNTNRMQLNILDLTAEIDKLVCLLFQISDVEFLAKRRGRHV